jgi:hypothetical protein
VGRPGKKENILSEQILNAETPVPLLLRAVSEYEATNKELMRMVRIYRETLTTAVNGLSMIALGSNNIPAAEVAMGVMNRIDQTVKLML